MTAEPVPERWGAEPELFEHWGERPPEARRRLLDDLGRLDPRLLADLRRRLAGREPAGPRPGIVPLPAIPAAEWRASREARQAGEALVAAGRTAFLTVAGGQGTRLGREGPKGCFPISPLRGASLFQIFAEKLLAARRRYGAPQRWYVMTSPLNHDATVEFFRSHDRFGLPPGEVTFFRQGLLPSLTPEGRLLLAPDGGLALNPDGHGGILQALRGEGLSRRLREEGVEELFCFQVDNPLVRLPDEAFVGLHRLRGSEMSSKVIPKAYPEERLGVPVLLAGRAAVIEYSDLDPESMRQHALDGSLRFAYGSIAIHVLNAAFVDRLPLPLPLHLARKRVRCLVPRAGGASVEERDAVKFESFIFDAVPLASDPLFVETVREEEFAPLKSASGQDSVATCVEGLVELASRWLESCGVEVPRDRGRPRHRVEISPLFAPDPQTLKQRLPRTVNRIDGDLLLA